MPKINDYPITNFVGLNKNKSGYSMSPGEMVNTLNLDLDEDGRARRRKGSQQFGNTISGKIIDSSYTYIDSTQNAYHLIISREANGVLYKVGGNYTTADLTTSSTTITVGNNSFFAASGTVEINGDNISYTGKNGTTELTGVTGISRAIPAYSAVHQVQSIGNSGVNTNSGAYFTTLNGVCVITGRTGGATFDGTTLAAISDGNEAQGLFGVSYRDRLYVAGSGSGGTNATMNRVAYSDAGDATSWSSTDQYFDVEDETGEVITGLSESSDYLFIWKLNSIFRYDEVQLKQSVWGVGAYNNEVIERIGGNFYTFCPSGVWKTTGFSAVKLSEPIERYLKSFRPKYDSAKRVITNCFSGQFYNKYYLYLDAVEDPDTGETLNDVCFVFDTEKENWTIQDSFTNFTHFNYQVVWHTGALSNSTTGGSTAQVGPALFAGDESGGYWKMFDDRFLDNETNRTMRGGDIIGNVISDVSEPAVVEDPINTILETPFYHLGAPQWWKNIMYVRVLIETGDFDVSYRLDKGDKITDWISLGNYNQTNKRIPLKEKEGYRIAFRMSGRTADVLSTFNGLIVEEIEAKQKK